MPSASMPHPPSHVNNGQIISPSSCITVPSKREALLCSFFPGVRHPPMCALAARHSTCFQPFPVLYSFLKLRFGLPLNSVILHVTVHYAWSLRLKPRSVSTVTKARSRQRPLMSASKRQLLRQRRRQNINIRLCTNRNVMKMAHSP